MRISLDLPDARFMPLLVMLAFVMCGMTVPSPVLPQFATALAGDPAVAGFAVSVFGFARLISNWPAGAFSEKVGRQPMLVAGPVIMAISGLVAALSTTFTMLLISRLLLGVGSAISMTVAMAAIADLSTAENRGRAMALVQGGALAGWALGPAVGGLAASLGGYAAPFWLQAAMMAGAAAIILVFQKETRVRVAGARGQSFSGILTMMRDIGFVAACVVTFSIFFDRTALSQYLMPLAGELEYGLTPGIIGFGMTLIAAGNALVLFFIGSLIDRHGAMRWLGVGSIITAIGLIVYTLGQTMAAYLAASFIVGIGTGFTGPASSAFAANQAPKGQFGSAMGVVRMVGDSAFVIGPMIMAVVVATPSLGIRAGFLVAAILGILSVAIAAFMVDGRR
ncbi:MAG: hypothetical protein RLZ98_1441 [Pseudomonadota bacterium]|jgi:MFS family permease